MRRGTKLLLLAGCALIVTLDAHRAFAVLAAGWRGPYASDAPDARTALAITAGVRTVATMTPLCLELARR